MSIDTTPTPTRRAEDRGIWCTIARRASEVWDFVDKRDIEKYAVAVAILYATYMTLEWSFAFAERHMDKSGIELAAVIAAIIGPWSAVTAGVIKWLFDARTEP